MIEELRYHLDGSRCLTLCQYLSDRAVGSNTCQECEHFKGNANRIITNPDGKKEQGLFIKCNYKEIKEQEK